MSVRKPLFALVACICVGMVMGAWIVGAASAATPYVPIFSFGSFGNIQGIAIDQENGDVYVFDKASNAVYKFTETGAPSEFSGLTGTSNPDAIEGVSAFGSDEIELAVDNSSGPAKGDIYIATGSHLYIYGPDGLPLGELDGNVASEVPGAPWGEPCGVAVDSSGHVYVGLYPGSVNMYTPTPAVVASKEWNKAYTSSMSGLDGLCNIGADSDGNVYASTYSRGPVTKYGALQFTAPPLVPAISEWQVSLGATLAVDLSDNQLYVDTTNEVVRYSSTGEELLKFGSGNLRNSFGLGVNDVSHDVYVSNGEAGQIEVYGTPAPGHPTIASQSVTDVASTSATLLSEINPHALATTYHYEYGVSTSYGASLPTPEAQLGAGFESESASLPLQGLQPQTTYHYRVVATNSAGTVDGPDETFTTRAVGSVEALPDGRQYELVSPPVKDGAEVNVLDANDGAEGNTVQASEDGSAITYSTNAPIGSRPPGNPNGTQIISRRRSGGWESTDIAIPSQEAVGPVVGIGPEYRAFSPDLTRSVVRPQLPTLLTEDAPGAWRTLYLRSNDGGYESLVKADQIPAGLLPEKREPLTRIDYANATSDFSHILLTSDAPLTPNAESSTDTSPNIYEWTEGQLQLVNVLPDGKVTPGGALPGSSFGFGTPNVGNPRHALSADGSQVVWGFEGGGLFDRDTVTHTTVQVDAAQGGLEKVSKTSRSIFQAASVDGTRIFFTAGVRLTPNANAGPDLYEYDLAGAKLTDLTPGIASASVEGVLGESEDGASIYFVAKGVLAGGAVGGQENIYLSRDENGSWVTRYVAALSAVDSRDWDINPSEQTTRVSADGRYLAFVSVAELTGYDNADAVSGTPDTEVYLYDGSANRLTCVSCNPTGSRPRGEFDFGGNETPMDPIGAWFGNYVGGLIPPWNSIQNGDGTYQSRVLSPSGRMFFDSSEALVPQDVDGTEDVYEFEPNGVGSCTVTKGCVSLISSGAGSSDSTFMDASVSGDDVFIRTRDRLTSEDIDSAFDVYDVHVCSTGSPCIAPAPVVAPACVTTDACRVAPSPQPTVFGPTPSATFVGTGNVGQTVETVKSTPKKATKKKPRKVKKRQKRKVRRAANKSSARRVSSNEVGR